MAYNARDAFRLETVALFPENYFLENLAVRADGSILVSALNTGELWFVPAPGDTLPVKPSLVARVDALPMAIVEVEPDVFYIPTIAQPTLQRVDLRGWAPGAAPQQAHVLTFPAEAERLNGACLIGPRTLAIADSAAALIWRVDLSKDGLSAKARIWLRDDTMRPGENKQIISTSPEVVISFPGVNGLRFADKESCLYFTSSAQDVFCRVAVDPVTREAVGRPEIVATGFRAADDFCLDEDARVAYVGCHITNTIQQVSWSPSGKGTRNVVLGEPFTEQLLGPSSLAWARGEFGRGRAAYVTTDGGFLEPAPDGAVRPAALLRLAIDVR
jgi:hypothetical protein